MKAHSSSGIVGEADAEILDVYRGANALVVLTDPTRVESLEYLKRVLKDKALPSQMPIAILANFVDRREVKIQVPDEEYSKIVEADPGNRFFFHCSMRSCFGLKELYEFLQMPFLKTQEKELLAKLQAIREEIQAGTNDLKALSGAQDYDAFLQAAGQAQAEGKQQGVQGGVKVDKAPANPLVKTDYEDVPDAEEPSHATPVTPAPTTATAPVANASAAPVPVPAPAGKEAVEESTLVESAPTGKIDLSNFDPGVLASDSDSDDQTPVTKPVVSTAVAEPASGTGVAALDDFDAGELDDGFWDD